MRHWEPCITDDLKDVLCSETGSTVCLCSSGKRFLRRNNYASRLSDLCRWIFNVARGLTGLTFVRDLSLHLSDIFHVVVSFMSVG